MPTRPPGPPSDDDAGSGSPDPSSGSGNPPSGPPPDVDALLERARKAAQSLPPPTVEELLAYAEASLPAERMETIALYLRVNPDYAALLRSLKEPDPLLHKAYFDRLAQLQARSQRTDSASEWWRRLKLDLLLQPLLDAIRTPMGAGALALALLLLVALPFVLPYLRSSALPEFGELPESAVRGGASPSDAAPMVPLTLEAGESLSLPPQLVDGQSLFMELSNGRLERLNPAPTRAEFKDGNPVRLPILVAIPPDAPAETVLAALQPLVQTADFRALLVSGSRQQVRDALTQALVRAGVSVRALSVMPPYVVTSSEPSAPTPANPTPFNPTPSNPNLPGVP